MPEFSFLNWRKGNIAILRAAWITNKSIRTNIKSYDFHHSLNKICFYYGFKAKEAKIFRLFSFYLWTCKTMLWGEHHDKGWTKGHFFLSFRTSPTQNEFHHLPLWRNALFFKDIKFIGLEKSWGLSYSQHKNVWKKVL